MALEGDCPQNGPLWECLERPRLCLIDSLTVWRESWKRMCIQSSGGVSNMKLNDPCQEPQQGQQRHILLPAGGVSKNISSAQVGGSGPAEEAPKPGFLGIPTTLQESRTASRANRCALQLGVLSSNPCLWCVNLRVKLGICLSGLKSWECRSTQGWQPPYTACEAGRALDHL